MGSPYYISQCTSRLHSPDKAFAEFQALSLIAESLKHPQRTFLSAFVQQAVDRELAALFFLNKVVGQNKSTVPEFLADWISLLRKIRPVVCESIDASLRLSIWQRDDGRSCILKANKDERCNADPILIHVLPFTLLQDEDLTREGKLYNILAVFIGQQRLDFLRSILDLESDSYDPSSQLMLLSSQSFEHLANGRLSLRALLSRSLSNSASYSVQSNLFMPCAKIDVLRIVDLENRATASSSLPNPLLFGVHRQFATALAWLEVADYMIRVYSSSCRPMSLNPIGLAAKMVGSWVQRCNQPVYSALQSVWLRAPVSLRATSYKRLASLGRRLYGHTGSDQTHRLPFNLYLRVGDQDWVPRHQTELQSLQMVEAYTRIPAPKGLDAVQHGGSSCLLMTGLPGHRLGSRLSTMTDEQVEVAAKDLKDYLAELRQVPNNTGSPFCIYNALGNGLLDWRIGDSQRKEMKLRDEIEFNQALTFDLRLDEDARKQSSRSHGVKHDIVFTHADLNLRNILVDEMGRISGIVDWECAGWYPEYWEHSKMHFAVRRTSRWIVDVVDRSFPAYRDELDAENMLTCLKPSW